MSARRRPVDLLALWRGAGDPIAAKALRRLTVRVDELMTAWAVERFGRPLDDLDTETRQQLRAEAVDAATAEL